MNCVSEGRSSLNTRFEKTPSSEADQEIRQVRGLVSCQVLAFEQELAFEVELAFEPELVQEQVQP